MRQVVLAILLAAMTALTAQTAFIPGFELPEEVKPVARDESLRSVGKVTRRQVSGCGFVAGQMEEREGVSYGPRMEGQLVGVEVGDINGDGKNEVALCFRNCLVAAKITAGKIEPVAEFPLESGNALSLNGLDLDGNGHIELYVTLEQAGSIRSIAIELKDNQFVQVVEPNPWFLRRVQLPGEGVVLLGQEYNLGPSENNQNISDAIFRVARNNSQLERGSRVELPNAFNLNGFQVFDQGGRYLIARLNNDEKLQVLNLSGNLLWESSGYFGGSEIFLTRPDSFQAAGTSNTFIPSRIEPGPDGSILVPANEGPHTTNTSRQFNSTHLKAVAYDGYALVERWHTKTKGGYLADFRMADIDNDGDKEIVMVGRFDQEGNASTMLIYEMR